MERENSVNGLLPDLDRLSLEKGRPLDVDDLDDEGWHAASEQDKIVELGSLGEGAGGAVTRCKLKEGKTVFALKVCPFGKSRMRPARLTRLSRSLLQTPTPTSRNRLFVSSTSTKIAPPTTSVATMVLSWTSLPVQSPLPWSSAKVVVSTAFTKKSKSLEVALERRFSARSLKVS
jgi:hypothetical protein